MSEPKILRWYPDYNNDDFRNISYTGSVPHRLEKVVVFDDRGLPYEKLYYASYNETTNEFEDLVIKEVWAWTEVVTGPSKVVKNIRWICEDDNEHPLTRDMITHYRTTSEKFAQGKMRRERLISTLKEVFVTYVAILTSVDTVTAMVEASNFFKYCADEIQSFIDTPLLGELQAKLIDAATITEFPWLDSTIPATLPQAVVDTIDWLDSTTPPGATEVVKTYFSNRVSA